MVSDSTKKEPQESITDMEVSGTSVVGDKKYGRMVRMFREGYLALHIYKNVYSTHTFYDIVIARKIRRNNVQEYVRGTNLKPQDLPDLKVLIEAAEDYLASVLK